MKITLTDDNGTYTVERECGPTIHSIFEELVIPVLNAAGFSSETINDYLESA